MLSEKLACGNTFANSCANTPRHFIIRCMLARLEGWVESWNRVKNMPEDELQDYLMKKCRNGFQMAKKPSRAQRDAWVTVLAEPDKGKNDLSPLAMRMVEHLRRRLTEEGYDVELNLDETGGVAYAEVHFRTLTKKDSDNSRAHA
jgi:hypothetical protein